MSNCLCCGKPLKEENAIGWHKSCIKSFFGLEEIPEIKIDNQTLETLANDSANKGLTIPGVQKKLSLHLSKEGKKGRLTLINYPTGYILKPQENRYICMPEAEYLVMKMAEMTGLSTVPCALIKIGGEYAYITKRIDRIIKKDETIKLAMEDFCQLDSRITADKYKGSYERCSKIINQYSSEKNLDIVEFYMRIIFCFVSGNSDMHLKNFSLIESFDDKNHYVLSPAYDLLPVNVIMPEDEEEFALTLNGKKTNIRRKDFLLFGDYCGLERKISEKLIRKVISFKNEYIKMCEQSYLPNEMKNHFIKLIEERCDVLEIN